MKGGKLVAAEVLGEEEKLVPAAMEAEMDGLEVVMKLPHIAGGYISCCFSLREDGCLYEKKKRRDQTHTHECAHKIGALVRVWRTEDDG